jgi:hypothetical protein
MIINNKVLKIDLSSITEKVRTKMELDEATATKAEELYKQYLSLRAKNPETMLVPPKLADHIWHEHILSSKQYVNDCQIIFGEYLHHNDTHSEDVLAQGWENTKHLFVQEFGVNLVTSNQFAADCSG